MPVKKAIIRSRTKDPLAELIGPRWASLERVAGWLTARVPRVRARRVDEKRVTRALTGSDDSSLSFAATRPGQNWARSPNRISRPGRNTSSLLKATWLRPRTSVRFRALNVQVSGSPEAGSQRKDSEAFSVVKPAVEGSKEVVRRWAHLRTAKVRRWLDLHLDPKRLRSSTSSD